MKLIALALLACLLCGQALAYSDLIESPDTLKIIEIDPYGEQTIMMAWQNNTTGGWTLAYTDTYTNNVKILFGNDTGFVRIT